jgi:hypothetical protein
MSKPNVKSVKFYRHATPEEYNNMCTDDGKPLEKMQVHMETVRKIFTDIRAYNENFAFRERHFDRSNSVKIMLYAKYMVVNKTGTDVNINKQTIKARCKDFLMANLAK